MVARAAEVDGIAPLSDQLAADLADGVGSTVVAGRSDGDGLAGFAQVSPRGRAWTMQVVIDPAARGPDQAVARRLVAEAVDVVAAAGGGRVDWWVFGADDAATELAVGAGFEVGRDLMQMRRSLPAEWSATVPTRSFRSGDEEAWVAVNNRAFAGHPEQGGWTLDTLHQRMTQAWFEPEGFRLHEIDGRLAAFCWTKVHTDEEPVAGEIYVIGVDPAFQGRGLGRQLTLAGLDSIAARGIDGALLYVDGANHAAVGLYRALGFAVVRTDRAFVLSVG